MGTYQGAGRWWMSLRPAWAGLLEGNMPSHCTRLQTDWSFPLQDTGWKAESSWPHLIPGYGGNRWQKQSIAPSLILETILPVRPNGWKHQIHNFCSGYKSRSSSCKLKMCKWHWAGREGRQISTLAGVRGASLQLCTHSLLIANHRSCPACLCIISCLSWRHKKNRQGF